MIITLVMKWHPHLMHLIKKTSLFIIYLKTIHFSCATIISTVAQRNWKTRVLCRNWSSCVVSKNQALRLKLMEQHYAKQTSILWTLPTTRQCIWRFGCWHWSLCYTFCTTEYSAGCKKTGQVNFDEFSAWTDWCCYEKEVFWTSIEKPCNKNCNKTIEWW